MQDPTILPIAISVFLLNAATTEVISSGRLVPIATIVSPIICSDNPISLATSTALSTLISPPYL